jgi:Uma2 family endonuclease
LCLPPSNTEAHLALKRAFYREAGVAEYWIVDPVQRFITIVRDGSADVRVNETLSWHPHRASMPFALDVQSLFR